jgi:pimeloyl-ACP methyl ester carboxylesterase
MTPVWKNLCAGTVLKLIFVCCVLHSRLALADELLKPCRVDGFAQQVQCGEIRRPLNPDEPKGKQIAVHFIVLSARDKNKEPDPIFLLAGGPGQSAIGVASWIQVVFEKLQRRHDLVFVDQRGTGKSAPLNCLEPEDLQGIGDAEFGVKHMLQCKAQLEKLPYGDLRFFTTTIAMQDLDAVRATLHYPKIDLIGVSYGTRAALEYQRLFPDHVRRAVLDGVVQPDQMLTDDDLQQALNKLFQDCAKEPRCQKAYPALRQDWKNLLAGLPRPAVLIHPRLGNTIKATVTRNDVLSWVSTIVYSPVNTSALPHAIEEGGKGNFNPMLALSGAGNLPNPGSIAMGMHFSVVCTEEYDRMMKLGKPQPDNDFGDMHNQEYIKVCQQWPKGTVPAGFYTTPKSATPVLLLSGGLDPVTPPNHAEKIAAALGSLARQIVLDNSGHGVLQQICFTDVATKFINVKSDSDAVGVDASCVKQIPRPEVWIAPSLPSANQTEPAKAQL